MIDLKNTNIILTGATGGIGNSILEKLISSGANVLATGTNEDKLKSIKEKYKTIITEKFDISNHSEIESFATKETKNLPLPNSFLAAVNMQEGYVFDFVLSKSSHIIRFT